MTAVSSPILTLEALGAVPVFVSKETSAALRLRPLMAEVGVLVVAGFLPLVVIPAVVEDEGREAPASVGSEILKPFLRELYFPLWRRGC